MHTPALLRSALKDHNLAAVAKATNLPYISVWRLVKGSTKRPSYETVKSLSEYLSKREETPDV